MTEGEMPPARPSSSGRTTLQLAGEWSDAFALFNEADAAGGSGWRIFRCSPPWPTAPANSTARSRHGSAPTPVLARGESEDAALAAVRVAMHLLFDTALMAPVRGWLARAEALLEGHPDTAVHAWYAVVRNYERLLAGDLEAARVWAQRAVDVGSSFDRAACRDRPGGRRPQPDPRRRRRARVALLDEAGVAAVTG